MTTKTPNTKGQQINILDSPEVDEVTKLIFGNIEHESDRGAVLVAQEILDTELTKVFNVLAPPAMGSKRVRELLSYPGVLSSFSAKTDVAFIAGYIGQQIYESIHTLRKIRNKAAHASVAFNLDVYRADLVELYRRLLGGEQSEDALRYLAIKMYIDPLIDSLLAEEIEGVGKVYKSREDILKRIGENSKTVAIANSKLAKIELGIAVVLLCAMITHSRDVELSKRASK